MPASMRAMIVKQGLEVSDAGRGELNAAYGGIGSIVGTVSPLLWGSLYSFFRDASKVPESMPLRLLKRVGGKGGHMLLASCFMLISYCLLKATRKNLLFLEPDERGPARTRREVADAKGSRS
eukprot:SAG31_NODE_4161_length_3522_cov_1.727432_2_plen_122_part_00